MRLGLAAEPGPERQRAGASRRVLDLVERPLHRLEQARLEHRQGRGRRGDRDVARVRAEGRLGREADGAREPGRAADDEHRARRVLVVARPAARHEPEQLRRHEVGAPSRPARGRCRRRRPPPRGSGRARRRGRAFRPWKVTVSSAWTAAPATSPVEASTPEGMSTATIGAPSAFIASINVAASGRGSPRKPVPKSPSTITSGLPRSPPDAASTIGHLTAALSEQLRGDPCIAAVRAAAADGSDAPDVRVAADELLGDGRARPLHQLRRGVRITRVERLGGAHLVGAVERLNHVRGARCRPRPRAPWSASSRARSGRRRPSRPTSACGRSGGLPASDGRAPRSPSR